MPNSLKCRLKGLVRKGLLSEKDLSRIYTDNDVIAELEQLKAELHETAEMHSNGRYYLHDEWIDEYIDKYISKLKGENKE